MHTNRLFGLAFALAAGCSTSPSDKPLPSATFTPHLESQAASVACGEDVAYYGATSPDLRYAFTYDAGGRMTHADGTWLADGSAADTIDYTWSGDNLTHLVETWGSSSYTIDASYDANGLHTYTWTIADQGTTDSWTYAFSSFVAPGQPTREDITQAGQPSFGYQLVYDSSNRLAQAIPDSGPTTTWTYDDQARTITEDTGNGAFHGVYSYDDENRELSASWGGTDPSVIDGEELYDWAGEQLNTMSFSSGTEQAPHQLELVSVATLRYDCTAARKLAGHVARGPRLRTFR